MDKKVGMSPPESKNSGYFTTLSWKKTALGSPIQLASSHPLVEFSIQQDLKPILLIGGVHGDEPEGVELATQTLSWLATTSGDTAHRSKLCPWIVIPCLNIDGDLKRSRVNGRGVDLNRNYPSRDWSAAYEKDRYFPGREPGSEPEIQGIVELITATKPRLIIHCHSWQPCVVATGSRALLDGSRLARASGYELRPEIGYPTPGSLSRYGWHDNDIPVICIEEQESLVDLKTIWPRFSSAMEEIFTDQGLRNTDSHAPTEIP